MRKLASIKTIGSITPIEGKDRIVLATVDGWQVIVQKDEYKVGDRTVYVEIDSQLPAKPEFAFLEKRKYRIKTLKMAGVLSQGICFPMSILPAGKYDLEQDVTDILGITKYEKYAEAPSSNKPKKPRHWFYKLCARSRFTRWLCPGKEKRGWPEFVKQTDETRCQNIPSVFNNKDVKYVVREKIEGQSGTFALKRKRGWFRDSFEFIVCSRTVRRWEDDGSSYWPIAKKFNIEDVLHTLIKDDDYVVLQGECVGPGIQGNIYKLEDYDFYAFNLFTPSGIVPCSIAEPLLAKLGIKWCPKIMDDYVLPDTVNEMLEVATGQSVLYPTLREGLVLRNYEHNTSFKAVSSEYLLKND